MYIGISKAAGLAARHLRALLLRAPVLAVDLQVYIYIYIYIYIYVYMYAVDLQVRAGDGEALEQPLQDSHPPVQPLPIL